MKAISAARAATASLIYYRYVGRGEIFKLYIYFLYIFLLCNVDPGRGNCYRSSLIIDHRPLLHTNSPLYQRSPIHRFVLKKRFLPTLRQPSPMPTGILQNAQNTDAHGSTFIDIGRDHVNIGTIVNASTADTNGTKLSY